MNKENLLSTASELKQIKESSSKEYSEKMDVLVGKMNQTMLARPDIEKIIGKNNMVMMQNNHANHARFMLSVMTDFDTNVLVDTILWVFNAYENHGFSSLYWAAQFNAWLEIYKEELSEETYQDIYPFYIWMQVNIPHFHKISKDLANLSNVGEH